MPAGEVVDHLVFRLAMLIVAGIIIEFLHHGNVSQFLAARELQRRAMTDSLTGLPNRRAMLGKLRAAQSRAVRHGHGYAVIMADLDHFKQVNDTHGHDVGDQGLEELGRRLQQSVRLEDHLARWGGEEFLLLIQDADQQVALAIAKKLRAAVADTPFATSAGALPITISLGLALRGADRHFETVCSRADKALYRAKQNGRNRTEAITDAGAIPSRQVVEGV